MRILLVAGPWYMFYFKGVYSEFDDKMDVKSFICRQVSKIADEMLLYSGVFGTQFFP